MSNGYTEDLAEFGRRGIKMLRDLLSAWIEHGLPEDFNNDGVKPAFNRNSGWVFLTNSDYQVALEREGRLESFYSTPYDGHEGTFEELLNEYGEMNSEDQEFMRDIAGTKERKEALAEAEHAAIEGDA